MNIKEIQLKINKKELQEQLYKVNLQACIKCGEIKPITEFNKDNTKATGLQSYCKACQSMVRKQAYRKTCEKKQTIKKFQTQTNIIFKELAKQPDTTLITIYEYLKELTVLMQDYISQKK